MNLCSHQHEEICYESNHCPMCDLIAETNEKIDNLENDLYEAKQKALENWNRYQDELSRKEGED